MEKQSFWYGFLRVFFVMYHNWFWYKSIKVRGNKNIPLNTPVFITPNHQNALMDATAFVFTLPNQPVFLARADIFKGAAAKILKFMRIKPIYRIRDGAESLGKNEQIFNETAVILEHNGTIGIFPEAQHWGFRKLRAIKKGVPRIAFRAEQKNDFKLGSLIVPVGLYYDEYQKFRRRLFINYGEAIPVAQFKDEFLENENKAYQALRKAISDGMKAVMMHIETNKYYDDVENIRTIIGRDACIKNGGKPSNIAHEFDADRQTVAKLDTMIVEDENQFLGIKEKADEYLKLLSGNGLGKWVVSRNGYSLLESASLFIAGCLLLNVFVAGLVANIIPKLIIENFVKAKVKDPQFVRSFKFALVFFLLPLNYLILLLIASIYIDADWYYWVASAIFMLVLGVFAHEYGQVAYKWWQSFKYKVLVKKAEKKKIKQLYDELKKAVL